MNDQFSDAALLLIGHGSTANADSAGPTYQHAAELRRRRIFAQVREAFWKQVPDIPSVLAQLKEPRLFAVPLFISEGYYTEQIIPAALGLSGGAEPGRSSVQTRAGQTLYYCAPVGTHDSMTDLIVARAREVIERCPFPRAPRPHETALFIAGHGTDRHENSRRCIERHADRIRALNLYGEVHAVFMEEKPRVGDCYAIARLRHLVVVPFFISDGLHSNEDIPVLLGEPESRVRTRAAAGQATWRNPTEREGKLVWYGRSVGTEPHLADLILQRAREAYFTCTLR